MSRSFLPLALLVLTASAAGLAACSSSEEITEEEQGEEAYSTAGTCDGLPRLKNVETPKGVCVGIAASGFKLSRGIAELPTGDLLLAEMGGWGPDLGGVSILRRNADKTFSKVRLLSQIDKPSGVAVGPDGLAYVGTPKDIFRFDPYEVLPRTGRLPSTARQPRLKQVIKNLPGLGRHPLQKFVFDKADPWTLFVNVGSASNNCEVGERPTPPAGFPSPCPEASGDAPLGAIRKYKLEGPDHLGTTFTTYARGLRNSMALAVHPTSGILLQAENSRDKIDAFEASFADVEVDLPHEELNVILENGNYGWPYCYDNGTPNPEYRGRVDCSNYKNPALLLPGHAAPLGMAYYTGNLFPAAYRNNLIIAYHGYRALGHRLAVVPVDAQGMPGGGEPLDIIRKWEKNEGSNDPLGTPVDVMVAKDGSIYVTEDKNGTVLRLSFDASAGNGAPMRPLPPPPTTPSLEEAERCNGLARRQGSFVAVQKNVIDKFCVGCHGVGPGYAGGLALLKCDAVGNAQRLLKDRGTSGRIVNPGDQKSELIRRLLGDGFPQMPAGGVEPDRSNPEHANDPSPVEDVRTWIREGAPIPR